MAAAGRRLLPVCDLIATIWKRFQMSLETLFRFAGHVKPACMD
jgi:hypothetical protein